MNVLKFGYYPKRYVFKNLRQFSRNVRRAWQRATKGYCDYDVWEIDTFLATTLSDMFEHLSKHHCGHPTQLSDKEWTIALYEMARHFRNTLEDSSENVAHIEADELLEKLYDPKISAEQKELINSSWCNKMLESSKFMEAERDKACDMLKKYYFHLWD